MKNLSIIFILILVIKSYIVYSQSGNLDSTYHFDGIAMPAYWQTIGDTRGQKLAIQSDGKAIVVRYHRNTNYDFALIRYNSDGSLDSTFGGDGLVTSDLFNGDDQAFDIAIQSDGKIVAAGYSYHFAYNQEVFSLARFNTNGTIDATFGTNGKAIAYFGSGDQKAYGVAIQADGKIVLAGVGKFNPNPVYNHYCVARFTSSGMLDNTFSGNGLWNSQLITNSDCSAFDVDIDNNQRIVVSGTCTTPTGAFMSVVRLNTTGNYDNTFDGDGRRHTQVNGVSSVCNNLVLQNDGKMMLVGKSNNLMAVKRLNIDGSTDSTFSEDGNQLIDFGSTSNNGYDIALDANQRIIIAGNVFINGVSQFAIARITPQGELDFSFNGDGKVIVPLGTSNNFLFGVGVQNDGKILATGHWVSSNTGYLNTIRLLTCNNTFSNQSFSECLTYYWPETNQTYNTSGTYYVTYTNAEGCDSIVSLNLTIYQNPDIDIIQDGFSLTAVQTGATYQWLDCNNNDNPIPGATNQTYVVTANGSYRCAVTLNGCTDYSNCTSISNVGINKHYNNLHNQAELYPNPTDGLVNVQSDVVLEHVIVYDLRGRILFSKSMINDHKLDLSEFENGVYLVSLSSKDNKRANFKIIKQ